MQCSWNDRYWCKMKQKLPSSQKSFKIFLKNSYYCYFIYQFHSYSPLFRSLATPLPLAMTDEQLRTVYFLIRSTRPHPEWQIWRPDSRQAAERKSDAVETKIIEEKVCFLSMVFFNFSPVNSLRRHWCRSPASSPRTASWTRWRCPRFSIRHKLPNPRALDTRQDQKAYL